MDKTGDLEQKKNLGIRMGRLDLVVNSTQEETLVMKLLMEDNECGRLHGDLRVHQG